MTGATICSGIQAPEAAMPWVDWKWCAEIEPFPCSVIRHHRPQLPNLGDVTAEDFIDRAISLGRLDLLVAGTPCQAFSVAGLRQSLADSRGNLTLRLVELTHAIKPGCLLWENVPGVLSTHDNAFGCFLAGLVGAAEAIAPAAGWTSAGVVAGPLGTAAWRTLDAQYFGLAQRRARVFVVFCFGDGSDPAEILLEFEGLRRDFAPGREARQGVTGGFEVSPGGGEFTDLAPTMDTLDTCDSLIVRELAGTLKQRMRGATDEVMDNFIAHSLRADGFDASEDGTGRGTPLVPIGFYGNDHGADATAGLMPTLRSMEGGGGNHPSVAFHENQRAEVTINDTAGALKNGGGKPGQGYSAVQTGMAVRRLTPLECERLQGFDDGYTLVPHRGKPAADGPRYRALGNSMAVPVVAWIGKRIPGTAHAPDGSPSSSLEAKQGVE